MLYSLQSSSTTISSSSLPAASVHYLARIYGFVNFQGYHTHFPAISLICSPSRLRPTLSSLALLTSPTFVPTTSLHVSEPTVFEKAFVIGQGHAAIMHKLFMKITGGLFLDLEDLLSAKLSMGKTNHKHFWMVISGTPAH